MLSSYILTSIWLGLVTLIVTKIIRHIKQYLELCQLCRKVPGHPTHWLKGNLNQVYDSLSYIMYPADLMRESGARVYRMWSGPVATFGVCHPETAKVILRTSEPKAVRAPNDPYRMLVPWLGYGLLNSDGKKWERNRRLITPAFHFEILKTHITEFNKSSDTLLEKMAEISKTGELFDIFPLISRATLDAMMRCALSYEGGLQAGGNDEHPYVAAVQKMGNLLFKRMLNPLIFSDLIYGLSSDGRLNLRLCDYVHTFTESLIKSRKEKLSKSPNNKKTGKLDFLDILLSAKDESGVGLTDEEIREEVDTFTFEGHDTTASGIAWAIYALARYPLEQEKVYKEVKTVLGDRMEVEWDDLSKFRDMTCFIKEVMRFYSPVPLIARRLTNPCTIDGIKFPAGSRMDINIYCLHHHPDVWPDHMEFRPQRFELDNIAGKDPYGYVPFSAGPRNCIGQNFALNEMKVLLSKTMQRFEVHTDPNKVPTFQPDMIMRSSDGIHVSLRSRD